MEGPPINYESYDRAENAQYTAIRIAIRPCRIVLYRNTPPAAIPIPSSYIILHDIELELYFKTMRGPACDFTVILAWPSARTSYCCPFSAHFLWSLCLLSYVSSWHRVLVLGRSIINETKVLHRRLFLYCCSSFSQFKLARQLLQSWAAIQKYSWNLLHERFVTFVFFVCRREDR